MSSRSPLLAALGLAVLVLGSALAAAAPPAEPPPGRDQAGKKQGGKKVRDPYVAYEAGLYDQALQGFRDRLARQPESQGLKLAEGGSAYKLGDFGAAETVYQVVAEGQDKRLAEHAFYNLGNTSYRQGKLEDAIRHYEAALGVDPEDADAKFNLDFVRQELERRKQEQKKQQQQQNQQQQDQQQKQQDPQQGRQEQDQQQQQQPQNQPGQPRPDPQQPGSDPQQQQQPEPRPGAQDEPRPEGSPQQRPGASAREMTKEEADRYLAMLEEGRPQNKKAPQRGQRAKGGKDW